MRLISLPWLKPEHPLPIDVHVIWLPDGMSCDGDTISVTAAEQPSIEELIMGAIPGIPKVVLHNRVLAYEQGGDDFVNWLHKAEQGRLTPFVLVIEGSIPNEKIKDEGYWTGIGNDRAGQPIPLTDWIDRLAPKAYAVIAAGTCATYGGIHAMAGNPTGSMGLADYLGWKWKSWAGVPIINVPGCPVQPDNMTETILYLLYGAFQRSGLGRRESGGSAKPESLQLCCE
jgi:hydrogenase small subunit